MLKITFSISAYDPLGIITSSSPFTSVMFSTNIALSAINPYLLLVWKSIEMINKVFPPNVELVATFLLYFI